MTEDEVRRLLTDAVVQYCGTIHAAPVRSETRPGRSSDRT